MKMANTVFRPTGSAQVHINCDAIPEYQRSELARFALDVVRNCFARPGEEEKFQKWLAERKARLTAK